MSATDFDAWAEVALLVCRIVWAQYKNGKCSDQLGEYTTGDNTPMRWEAAAMVLTSCTSRNRNWLLLCTPAVRACTGVSACRRQLLARFEHGWPLSCRHFIIFPCRMNICPWGTSLLVGNANGGIRRLQIGTESYHSKIPRLVDVSGQQQKQQQSQAATPARPVGHCELLAVLWSAWCYTAGHNSSLSACMHKSIGNYAHACWQLAPCQTSNFLLFHRQLLWSLWVVLLTRSDTR